ncbi:MAG: hypothetical protein ACHREM_28120, partial [Polyangiales bacterium]
LNAVSDRLEGDERLRVARLNLEAGRHARRSAAFPLALDCFSAGVSLLPADVWTDDYPLALALHGGAAESAYLSARWSQLADHVVALKANGRTMLDQLVGWEAQIDGHIARLEYAPAVGAALEALQLLNVHLPSDPGDAEIGAELQAAMAALARVGPEGLMALPLADDPAVAAAMRMKTRIGSATYFAKPKLFPVLACRQIVMSVERGLSHATPYALSVYGIVLNTIGLHREAHTWGQAALRLIDRFEDRSLEPRTLHVIHDLVCNWVVPLAGTLEDIRRVIDVGRASGEIEYAAYAAHAYTHNAFYVGRDLEQLLVEAQEFTLFIRHHQQKNALHIHEPWERLLHCFTGRAPDAARLNGGGFDEETALAAARETGSRSAQCMVRLVMGIVRFHFGSMSEASEVFEAARPYLDGIASAWHIPMFHQYAALAIHALPAERREALRPQAEASLAELRTLAAACPENFAHRVALVEAAGAAHEGRFDAASTRLEEAIRGAEVGRWCSDLAMAHELAATIAARRVERADAGERASLTEAVARHAAQARAAYATWGVSGKRAAYAA